MIERHIQRFNCLYIRTFQQNRYSKTNCLSKIYYISKMLGTVEQRGFQTSQNCSGTMDIENKESVHKDSKTMSTSNSIDNTEEGQVTPKLMIVGLGNHDMSTTRHSVGMKYVDYLAQKLDKKWSKSRTMKSSVIHQSFVNPSFELVLLKPRIPMNCNGKSIIKAAAFFNIQPSNIYLIHDELDKAIGKYSLKNGGSARGHNGVRSSITYLQTDVMPRLLLGIDRPASKRHVADYVLSPFTKEEKAIVYSNFDEATILLLKDIKTRMEIDLLQCFRSDQETKETT